jgi:hypothetical protein
MIQIKRVLKSWSLVFSIMILFGSCGKGNSSNHKANDNSDEAVIQNKRKVVVISNEDVDKATGVTAKKEEYPKGEIAERVELRKSVTKKEEKKIIKKIPKKRAKMYFPEKVFDFGFIMQGDEVKHDFHFKNVGNDDLIIERVEPSCGCTVPIYPKKNIAPGEEGTISVTFKSAGKLGRQVPTIKVLTNYRRSIKLELHGIVDTEREKPKQVSVEKKDTTQ